MGGVLSTAKGRGGRILIAVAMVASVALAGVDLAGAEAGTPSFTLDDPTIERGGFTTFSSTFTMVEGTVQVTLNLPPGADLTATFVEGCGVSPVGGRTCTVSPTGPTTAEVTVSNGGAAAPPPETVSVKVDGKIAAGADFDLTSAEGAGPGTAVLPGLSITVNQTAPAQATPALTSPTRTLNVTANPATDAEIQITTTAPATAGATAQRGGTINYTATLRRDGFTGQATTAMAALVGDPANGTTPAPACPGAADPGPCGSKPVLWALGEVDKTVTLTVNVPSGLALGATATYRIEVTYDPNSLDAVAVADKEIGADRSFQIVAGPGDAVVTIATTAPTEGQDVPRGTNVTYTATLTRDGNRTQVTTVQLSLLPVGDQRGTTPGPPVEVVFGTGVSTATGQIIVNVPTSATPGNVSYRFQAVYDPSVADGVASSDTVTDAPRSFDVVVAQPVLTLTPPNGTINRGEPFNLVATVDNPAGGQLLATGALTVSIPAGMSVSGPVSAPDAFIGPTVVPDLPDASPQTVAVTYAEIPAGQSRTLTIPVVALDTATKKLDADLRVTARFVSATTGPTTFFDDFSDFELRPDADLTLSISPLSQTIQKKKFASVTVTLGNLGPEPATGVKTVTITVTNADEVQFPVGCTPTSATQATCTVNDPLLPGGANSKSFVVKVKRNSNTGPDITVQASLTSTSPEFDKNADNNKPVTATVGVLQSESDLSIAPGAAAELIFGVPEDVTFTVSVSDTNGPNKGDPAEGVQVTIPVPAGLQATAASFTLNGSTTSCTGLPAGSGGTVTCAIGDIDDGKSATITLTLTGTAVVAATPVVATATATNLDPTTPNTAQVLVTVVAQPVDLALNTNDDRIITTNGPSVTTGTDTFVVQVTNQSPLFTAGSYTLTVDLPAGTEADLGLSGGAPCTTTNNRVTCDGVNLAPGATREFTITTNIKVPGPVVVRAGVVLNTSAALPQVEPEADKADNEDRWNVTRNIPPAAAADVGPTVPAGSVLVFDVLNDDTDLDSADIPNLAVGTPVTGGAGLPITVVDKKLRIEVPSGTAATTLTLAYSVIDGRGGSTATTLKIRVASAVSTTVDGSFGRGVSSDPKTFEKSVSPDLLDETATPINVLDGPLGKDAEDADFPAGTTHDLLSVSLDSLNVKGSKVTREPGATGDPALASYVPAPSYTSDPKSAGNPHPILDAPADSFTYRTSGVRGPDTIFTVDATVTAEVRNQQPIGIDDTFDVPNNVVTNAAPALNDLDGNTSPDANGDKAGDLITVTNPPGQYTFDDEGEYTTARGFTIKCIGPVPTLDPVSGLPVPTAAAVCGGAAFTEGFVGAGVPLELQTPDSKGKVTVTLANANTAQTQANRTVEIKADATVVGDLPFAYVIVDNYGGVGFGRAIARVPNTPPQVIEGVRTVLKNTPTLVVDTRLAAQDVNGDNIIISQIPARTEHGTVVKGDNDRTITYTPDRDYLGPDKLLYSVTDNRSNGAASAVLELNVIEQPSSIGPAGGDPTSAGAGGSPGGSLAATGGDPLALTAAAGTALLLGLLLVQAGRRRESRPLLDRARHLRT